MGSTNNFVCQKHLRKQQLFLKIIAVTEVKINEGYTSKATPVNDNIKFLKDDSLIAFDPRFVWVVVPGSINFLYNCFNLTVSGIVFSVIILLKAAAEEKGYCLI